MIYVMSGIRGNFDAYKALIGKIKLKKDDDLFLLGNVICGGEGGMDILLDAMNAENIFPIAAKSEIDAARFLSVINNSKEKPDESIREEMAKWFTKGGFACANAFMKLESDEDKEYVLEYLSEEFTLVDEIKTDGKTFILSAKGLGGFLNEKDAFDYSAEELTDGDFDPTVDEFPDKNKYIVCGDIDDFTPDEEFEGKICTIGKNIILNHAENRQPCCMRLNDMKEFYV